MKKGVVIIIMSIALFLSYRSMSIFVLPPIEPLSKGAVIIMWRDSKLGFLASPDSVCKKQFSTESPVCRGSIMAMYLDKEDILVKLPYIQPLHWLA